MKKNIRGLFFVVVMLVLCGISMFALAAPAPGTDLFAGTQLNSTVEQTFGPGSTLMKVLYGSELFLGIIGYMKSKNPLVLIGIPVIMIASAGLSTLIQ